MKTVFLYIPAFFFFFFGGLKHAAIAFPNRPQSPAICYVFPATSCFDTQAAVAWSVYTGTDSIRGAIASRTLGLSSIGLSSLGLRAHSTSNRALVAS
jgi:hypothetical protein